MYFTTIFYKWHNGNLNLCALSYPVIITIINVLRTDQLPSAQAFIFILCKRNIIIIINRTMCLGVFIRFVATSVLENIPNAI